MKVLGSGHTGFGPGSDGGRDGYFEGEAPYPSEIDRWSGRWYIQSKFHATHLSTDSQKWLIEQIEDEIKQFVRPDTKRKIPDNWIVATNIDPSGVPNTGAFDAARLRVNNSLPQLEGRFHIWGGRKILDFLNDYPRIGEQYGHFLTPGHVITDIYNYMRDSHAEAETILRYFLVKQFGEHRFTKLEQAGSEADMRPGIHELFIDLPFHSKDYDMNGMVTEVLARAAACPHNTGEHQPASKKWAEWNNYPSRAKVWFVKGGPGQGKSTIGQYFCQLQRAALILEDGAPSITPAMKKVAEEITAIALTDLCVSC